MHRYVLPMVFLTIACGGDDAAATDAAAASSGSTSGGGGSGGGAQTITCDGAPPETTLGGTWAARGRLAVHLNGAPGGAITICPTDQIGEAGLVLMMTFDHKGGTTVDSATATLCSVDLPIVKALVGDCDPASPAIVDVQIIAPKALVDSLPDVSSTPVKGTLDGTAPGSTLTLERLLVTVGSTKPGADMPKWDTNSGTCNTPDVGWKKTCEATCVDDCASLRDDDKDGYPGATVQVCGYTASDKSNQVECHATAPDTPGATIQGQGYVDIQVDPQFGGKVESSCEIRGNVDTSVLYNLVGGSVYLAGGAISITSAISSLPTFEVDPQQSAFRMVRVDGEYGAPDWSVDASDKVKACATILEHVNDL